MVSETVIWEMLSVVKCMVKLLLGIEMDQISPQVGGLLTTWVELQMALVEWKQHEKYERKQTSNTCRDMKRVEVEMVWKS